MLRLNRSYFPGRLLTGLCCGIVLVAGCGPTQSAQDPDAYEHSTAAFVYPPSAQVSQSDTFHGVKVDDPYRWLEADVREDEQVRVWVDAQQEFTESYLDDLPRRDTLYERIKNVWNTERYGVPHKIGGRYFYSYNDGQMNQSQVLMQSSLGEQPQVLFDPNSWSENGATALGSYFPGPQGKYVAYLVQVDGSDWREARIRDLNSGEDLADKLQWLKFTQVSWRRDGSGFYYSRYPAQTEARFHGLPKNHAVYFHKLGSPQQDDVRVFSNSENPGWLYSASLSKDGEALIITTSQGTDARYLVDVIRFDESGEVLPPVAVVRGFNADFSFVGKVGDELIFRTDWDAPKGRIIALALRSGNDAKRANSADDGVHAAVRQILPQRESVIDSVQLFANRLVVRSRVDARSRVETFDRTGEPLGIIPLPGIGTASGFGGNSTDAQDSEVFYSFSSINSPHRIKRVELRSLAQTDFGATEIGLDLDGVVVRQDFFKSVDGTQVPMFIAHKEGLNLDGSHPTLLYGYGGFNISLTPTFSVMRAVWIEQGGVFAMPNIRGGGEYGEAWHQQGTKLNKQNVFDDFISAAEFLVDSGYTKPKHLGIMGGSNGGLLVGAVLNQRPDLFGAALPLVGVMDMLRFHQFTAGAFWVDDYGSVDNPDEFKAMYAYSPYHNIVAREYPAVLVGTADTDDRVVPGHSFKYAARLQEMQQGAAPVLIRIESNAGHGSGKPKEKRIQEYADYWAFLFHHLE